jgi:hypothetical protein
MSLKYIFYLLATCFGPTRNTFLMEPSALDAHVNSTR